MKIKLPKMSVPLFNCGDIYLCRTEDELAYFYQLVEGEMPNTVGLNGFSAFYIHQKTAKKIFLIAVLNGKISTLAHEISHTIFTICNLVNVEVKEGKANETFCYLMSNIMEFALKHFKKLT